MKLLGSAAVKEMRRKNRYLMNLKIHTFGIAGIQLEKFQNNTSPD
jgi:hypothetical protein